MMGLAGEPALSVDGGISNWELRRPFNFRRSVPFRGVTLIHMADSDSVMQVVKCAYEVLAVVDEFPLYKPIVFTVSTT
jgi:hypothetical protein